LDLLVLEPAAERRPHIVQRLDGLGGRAAVRGVSRARELAQARPEDLVAIAWDDVDPDEREDVVAALRESGARALVMSAGLTRGDYASLFASGLLLNLVACQDGLPRRPDLEVVAARLLGVQVAEGLAAWLPAGAELRRFSLRRASERERLFSEVEAFTAELGLGSRFASLYRAAADELVTNALFNAPVDGAGASRFAHVNRAEEIELGPREAVDVVLARGGALVGISVRDSFGSLSPATLTGQLARCFARDERQVADKPGGAGLGLYVVLDASSHLVVDIAPGRATEFVVLLDVSGTYKDFAQRSKSFNVFVSAGGAGGG